MTSHRSSEQIRQEFLRFFEEKGHTIVPSASIVPHDDPTLLFTNAGMNQFKDVFLGAGSRSYVRAADTQKCLRVSGKHNDLEEVGHDTYHHTFFEMLGNWSFGDYFKREAIAWAWELLVDRWGLAPDRLYATVHQGDERLGLQADEEAAEFWRTVSRIDPTHIKYCGSKDNFWMMGDTGPCGPCSEIHIDLRSDDERARVPGIELVNADDPRVMEIWNLVFIQYNAQGDGSLRPLKAQHVDTGMGFERVVAVLQGKSSNYDTDLFAPILAKVAQLSPREDVRGYEDVAVQDATERERVRVAMRVVADHVRACAFTVADGVMPGNVGRGYVIRRILRRAVRYGYQTLGFREPFLNRLIEPLREKMGATFPELKERQAFIERVIRSEEENFLETLGTGITFFERIVPYVQRLAGAEETAEKAGELQSVLDSLRADRQAMDLLEKAYPGLKPDQIVDQFSSAAARREVPGEVAFLLHDTFGFPVDLTELMAREESLGVDMARYADLMQEQKSRARAAASFRIEGKEAGEWHTITVGDDSEFVGYDRTEVEGATIRLARSTQPDDAIRDDRASSPAEIVLDVTPFYAESGGQLGDVGTLTVGDDVLRVLDTQKQGGRIVHLVDRMPESLDAPVVAVVDSARRRRTAAHHTATHLLHAALRERLGKHVAQKGSLVAPDRLRFDFSHFERVPQEDLRAIEVRVNEAIRRNILREEERNVP
ncbi:MAG TPA: alanine--tRNA ligase, partial [Rhodothermales bacterium]